MTYQSKTSYFMADSASTDKRSARAHIQGRSLRVQVYRAFEFGSTLIGRRAYAANDFSRLSRYLYHKLPAIQRGKQEITHFLVAATGLLLGGALSLYFLAQ